MAQGSAALAQAGIPEFLDCPVRNVLKFKNTLLPCQIDQFLTLPAAHDDLIPFFIDVPAVIAPRSADRQIREFAAHIRTVMTCFTDDRQDFIEIYRNCPAVGCDLQAVIFAGGNIHMTDAPGLGMSSCQFPESVPIQSPAAEQADDQADPFHRFISFRRCPIHHLIGGQRLAGCPHNTDLFILFFLQCPVYHSQGRRDLIRTAAALPHLFRVSYQYTLRIQNALRVSAAASISPSLRASSQSAVTTPPCWAPARICGSAALASKRLRKGPIPSSTFS